jgi:hypothetical protein
MSFILSKTFILSQLAQMDITPAQFDAASVGDKAMMLKAVASASYSASVQSNLAAATAVQAQQAQLLDLQIAWYQRMPGLPLVPSPPASTA